MQYCYDAPSLLLRYTECLWRSLGHAPVTIWLHKFCLVVCNPAFGSLGIKSTRFRKHKQLRMTSRSCEYPRGPSAVTHLDTCSRGVQHWLIRAPCPLNFALSTARWYNEECGLWKGVKLCMNPKSPPINLIQHGPGTRPAAGYQ